jgi:hypothetical protein
MGYVVLRTEKLKSGQAVRRSLQHAFRERDTPNADSERRLDNSHHGALTVSEALGKFNARLPEKVRKNAVLGIEYLIGGSPEVMHGKTRDEQDAYFRDAFQWLQAKHGAANVIYACIHRDEQTPHLCAYVVPIDERGKLNCRAFLGAQHALREMQTEFSAKVGAQHGLERGIEGSKAKHTTIQQYYARVNAQLELLPEVITPLPKALRSEPEKPGLFAGNDAKREYQEKHKAWMAEQTANEKQKRQHMAETKARRDSAVAIVEKAQQQAIEAASLKIELEKIKKSNGHYVKKSEGLANQVRQLQGVVDLFTPAEIKAAQVRRQQQEAESARQADVACQKAAETARTAVIEAESAKRVKAIPKLLKLAGTEYLFAMKATEALKQASDDPHRVDWRGLEARVAHEAIVDNGQPPENVAKALLTHSPACADQNSHAEMWAAIRWIEDQYEQDRAEHDKQQEQEQQERDSRPRMS